MTLKIRYLEHTGLLNPGETVLEALEKAGASVGSSCRAGACQSCMLRAVEGVLPKGCQDGIKVSLRQTGHFLSCLCKPSTDLVCEPANSVVFRSPVAIKELRSIGPSVALVRFIRPPGFDFKPGQFITLKRSDGLARSYSLASSAQQNESFDIHVRRIHNGQLSTWFHDTAKTGDELWLEGPKGDCQYYPEDPLESLVLVGTGTGIAPLFAIAVEAVTEGHLGSITIYQGALSQERLYFVDELMTLARLHKNVTYRPCVLHPPVQGDVRVGDIRVGDLGDFVLAQLADMAKLSDKKQRVYLCGDPVLVRSLKKRVFLAGVSMNRIHSDPFIGTQG